MLESLFMDILWQELSLGLGDTQQFVRVVIRLLAAVVLGGVIGFERETKGKSAGFRTHILVTLGTCAAVLAGVGYGMNSDGLSRVIQGLVTGIGFIGAGSIIKHHDEKNIRGLTTAAGIWVAAAIGIATGLGEIGLAILTTIIAFIVLAIVGKIEKEVEDKK